MKILPALLLLLTVAPIVAVAQQAETNLAPKTRIEVDEENHVIRFFIKGEEAARLTEGGFELRDNLVYGGVLRDQGQDGFNANQSEQENADAP